MINDIMVNEIWGIVNIVIFTKYQKFTIPQFDCNSISLHF